MGSRSRTPYDSRRVAIWLLFDIFLLLGGAASAEVVHFDIDTSRDVKPISPYIYGVNQKLEGPLARMPIVRVGGNRWTAYNWVNNASNAGNDYQFQNDGMLAPAGVLGDSPGGGVIDSIRNAAEHDAALILTVPINGYVSADKNGGGDVRRSGADYLKTRFRPEHAKKGSPFTLEPDPHSADVYEDEFVNWVKSKAPHGFDSSGPPVFFSLDNEPDLWSLTHAEVHPKNPTYAELIEKTVEYAGAIKAVAPRALVFGPVNYGWQGYVRLQAAADAGNRDFQEVYLSALRDAEKRHGRRLLDVLDVHWYPEARGGGVRISEQATGPQVVAARLQAPRSLWDPNYTESSWITDHVLHAPIALLPRLQKKIDANYPGTKLAVTEYNYGAGDHISGGVAEADVLGVFGRSGVFAACEWPMARRESFVIGALRMYRDFDAKGARFGDRSVRAETESVERTSVYASLDSAHPGRLTAVLLNKTDAAIDAKVRFAQPRDLTHAVTYQLTGASPDPKPGPEVHADDQSTATLTLPAYSVVMVELAR